MRCTSPRTVGFQSDGKTLSWSPKKHNKEYATFQMPCGQCLQCRLEYARQWAVRCVHEAKMHENNCFVTLTYAPEKLTSPKLIYADFQKFMKKLRKVQNAPIGVFVTGEYGDEEKRPHWHAILFNYAPSDGVRHRTTQLGHEVFTSKQLTDIWGHGHAEYGSVTFESAGYCARYAAKKIVHGKNQTVKEADYHEYQPISKKSSKHAIGKRFIEKYYEDIFNYGKCLLYDRKSGRTVETAIPRYYEKWLKEHRPAVWLDYLTRIKLEAARSAQAAFEKEQLEYLEAARTNAGGLPLTKNQIKKIIQDQKFEKLQAHLKL